MSVLGQWASMAFFAASITSNPWRLCLLGVASFSAVLFAVESIRTESSQPCWHIVMCFIAVGHLANICLILNCGIGLDDRHICWLLFCILLTYMFLVGI